MTDISIRAFSSMSSHVFQLCGGRSISAVVDLDSAGRNAALEDSFTLQVSQICDQGDVHYPIWEMHPEGDELLVLLSGSISVEEDEGPMRQLLPGSAVIVSAGIWHRLIVHEPSEIITITPRHKTAHKEGK